MDTFVFEGMTPELQDYLDRSKAFYAKSYKDREEAEEEKLKALEKLVSKELIKLHTFKRREWLCRDETRSKDPIVVKSGSGRYELHLTSHSNGKGYWGYTKGKVFRDGTLVTEVVRNYSSFPHLFVENHPNGHPYLIAGEDYQGQTIIELDTGRRLDFLPPEAEQGHGFCWSSYEFDPKSQLLVVNGCHWACPYEYRLYDFSDPIGKGWEELTCEGHYIDSDSKAPVIEGDIIKTYETKYVNEEDEDLEDTSKAPRIEKSIKTFRREGNKLVFIEEWVSEEEKETRRKREEAEKRYIAWEAEFKATDPLYLAYVERVKDAWLVPADYMSRGITHDRWCPDFKVQEPRWCRRIYEKKTSKRKLTIDYEWAVKTGPVKLEFYIDEGKSEAKFFPHSVEGVNAAFDLAKQLIEDAS